MKIKIIQSFVDVSGAPFYGSPGQIAEVDDALAVTWINAKFAIAMPDAPKRESTALKGAPETTSLPSADKRVRK